MNKLKRLSLLPEPEIADLYARPVFNHNEPLLYFEMDQTQKAIIGVRGAMEQGTDLRKYYAHFGEPKKPINK